MNVLVTGAGGMLARAVTHELRMRGTDVVALDHTMLDVRDRIAVHAAISSARPSCVIHCAAYTRVDDAEADEGGAFAVNADGTLNVANACKAVDARLLYPGTDYVFDGQATRPYMPSSPTAPLNAYGRSKLAGEEAARAAGNYLIVRTSWLYGAGGRNFVATILQRAREVPVLEVVNDQRGAPTWTADLARTFAELLDLTAPAGVYHATNRGDTTWFDLACAATRAAGLLVPIQPISSDTIRRPAIRPRYSVLDCTSTDAIVGPMRMWHDALQAALVAGV